MKKTGPMRCRQMLAKLSSYIDEELDEATCCRLEAHLADCPPCVEFIKTLRKTVCLVHEAGKPRPVPARAHKDLQAKLKACAAQLQKRR